MDITFTFAKGVFYSKEFIQGCLNRIVHGNITYGPIHLMGSTSKSTLPPSKRIELTYKKWKRTGNLELLMDLANYCHAEFIVRSHPKSHFKVEDSGRDRIV